MAVKSNSITREECASINKIIMEKLDAMADKVEGIAIAMASLPGNLIEKLDDRYANKNTETEVKEIKTKMDARTYEWMRYLAGLIIGAGFAYLWMADK